MLDAVRDFATEEGLLWEPGLREGEIVVTLPGEAKLATVASLVVGAHDVRVQAFVIRQPDENHQEFYATLLRRNVRLPGMAYALDASGDVYVTGRLPNSAVTPQTLDRMFGVLLEAADQPFNDLLVIGFLTSMRREWAWRVSRGESLRNLEAFRSILQRPGDPPPD